MIANRLFLLLLAASLASVATVRQPLVLPVQDSAKAHKAAAELSGMYSFLREGEFLQLTVEDGKLSGYVSRFGDTDSDKGQFVDQFLDKTSLAGDHLSFNTKTVHGVSYDFTGTVATTAGKQPDQEGYHVIKGTLVQHTTDAKGVDKPMQRDVEFKSFPSDLGK